MVSYSWITLKLSLDLNTNFYALVDQLVDARGKVFLVKFSTLTGYIDRLRELYSVKGKD
jgi:hypothetical protein